VCFLFHVVFFGSFDTGTEFVYIIVYLCLTFFVVFNLNLVTEYQTYWAM